MKRRSVTLIVLGAAAVLMAAIAGIVTRQPWSTGAADAAATPIDEPREFFTISEIDRSRLISVELISAFGAIELTQTQGAWEITKPARLGVKSGPLNDLLYSLTNLVSERVIDENPMSLAPYGLETPAVTVKLTLDTGEVRELYLGDMTPAADSYYLMAEGNPRVFTVREHHGTYFHYGIPDLWEGARSPIDGSYIVALKIEKQGKPMVEIAPTEELYRTDIEFRGTTLSVVYPWVSSPKAVDLGFLTTFVMSLAGLQDEVAVDANPPDKARYGLVNPSYELLVRDGSGGKLHVVVGKQEGEVLYLQFPGDPAVYAGDPSLLSLLEVDPFQFVSKYAAIVSLDTVDRLTIASETSEHVLEIRRKEQGSEDGAVWLVDGQTVEVQRFKSFYTFAISLQIDGFHDDTVDGPPAVTMSFGLNTGPVPALDVEFIPYSQEFYAVRKNGEGDILVNRQQVGVLLRKLEELAAAAKG